MMEPDVHHCSFEIHDFDTQALGHRCVASKRYESVWIDISWAARFSATGGPGPIYDRTLCGRDLVNEDTPVAHGPAVHEGLSVWGPEVLFAFLD